MQSYVPQEPRALFGVAAFTLTVLTMATLVAGPAMLAQRHAPPVLTEATRSAPATRELNIAPTMVVVLQRAADVEAVRTSATTRRRGNRG